MDEILKQRSLYLEKVYSQIKFKRKEHLTKLVRNGFRKSMREDSLFLILKDFYSGVIRESFCEKFPFRVDFYVPEKDLFIEYQGFWTHGKHPFDISSEKDLTILKKWRNLDQRIYKNGIDVWSVKDPVKRKIAEENNIKLVEIFSLNLKPEKIKNFLENFNQSGNRYSFLL